MPDWHGAPVPVCALTETRLLPAKTQRFIEFLRERLQPVGEENRSGVSATPNKNAERRKIS
jgi:hypothetical protein